MFVRACGMLRDSMESGSDESEPAEPRRLRATFVRGEDVTWEALQRFERLAKIRRRISMQAILLRVRNVLEAYERARAAEAHGQQELQPLVGELENLGAACFAWARYIRAKHHL